MEYQGSPRNCGPSDARSPHAHLEFKALACMCSAKVLYLFVVFLALALGLIFGAVFAAVILPALPAVIVFAVVMAVLILALVVYRFCICCRHRRCE